MTTGAVLAKTCCNVVAENIKRNEKFRKGDEKDWHRQGHWKPAPDAGDFSMCSPSVTVLITSSLEIILLSKVTYYVLYSLSYHFSPRVRNIILRYHNFLSQVKVRLNSHLVTVILSCWSDLYFPWQPKIVLWSSPLQNFFLTKDENCDAVPFDKRKKACP